MSDELRLVLNIVTLTALIVTAFFVTLTLINTRREHKRLDEAITKWE